MEALAADVEQVHRQMPEFPAKAIDDMITDIITEHVAKAFTELQSLVLENFQQQRKSIMAAELNNPTESKLQDYLEKNTHYVVTQLQSVMNNLQVSITRFYCLFIGLGNVFVC